MNSASHRLRLYVGLSVGVFAVSFAAIFIRLADEAPPLTIASYRLGVGALVMILFAGLSWVKNRRSVFQGVNWDDLPLLGFSALCLSIHFWTWIVSLNHTSVASSVVLVTTNPLIVAVASWLLWSEPVYRATMFGVVLGIVGGGILAVGDFASGGRELFGDAMAFLGAIAVVGYVMTGRKLRRRMPALSYNLLVYSGTAMLLILAAVIAGEPFTGFRTETYLWLLVMALIPQAIGHSLLNWSLGYVTATAVTIAVMAEPVIATAAAISILGEFPPPTSVLGGVVILVGIYVALRPRRLTP